MDVGIEKQNNRAIVRLNGRFDLTANLTFRNATRPLLADGGVDTLVVDFTQVPFIDSSALGLLLLLREQAQAVKKQVALRNCGPELEKVLSISQFHRIFHIE